MTIEHIKHHARRLVGELLRWILQTWIRWTGRRIEDGEAEWLSGYAATGHAVGYDILREVAERHDFVRERADDAGLLPSFEALRSDAFDPDAVDERVHHFYEATRRHALDVRARWFWPLYPFASLLIRTVCHTIDQFNLPLPGRGEDSGGDHRITNHVVRMRERASGKLASVCWLRECGSTGRVMYAGFYGTCRAPSHGRPCVKVVFPIPDGYICVLLDPTVHPDGGLELVSRGQKFGDAGFYWVQRDGAKGWRARYVRLHESIRVFVDADGTLRTDHVFRLRGIRFLHLAYEIRPAACATRVAPVAAPRPRRRQVGRLTALAPAA